MGFIGLHAVRDDHIHLVPTLDEEPENIVYQSRRAFLPNTKSILLAQGLGRGRDGKGEGV